MHTHARSLDQRRGFLARGIQAEQRFERTAGKHDAVVVEHVGDGLVLVDFPLETTGKPQIVRGEPVQRVRGKIVQRTPRPGVFTGFP